MSEFKQYRRKSISEMRPVIFGEDLTGVSISDPDKKLMQEFPNIFAQGYVARNPKNHEDMWYVAKDYFDDNLEEIPSSENITGINLIAQERLEQIEKHGRSIGMDIIENPNGQLKQGAIAILEGGTQFINSFPSDWNPNICGRMISKPYKERLIIAGAFIAAELDRLIAIEKELTNQKPIQ